VVTARQKAECEREEFLRRLYALLEPREREKLLRLMYGLLGWR
jgi:hypothetical protein